MALDIETASRRLAQEQSQLAQAKAALSQAQAEYNQAVASGKIKPGTPEAIEFRRQLNIPSLQADVETVQAGVNEAQVAFDLAQAEATQQKSSAAASSGTARTAATQGGASAADPNNANTASGGAPVPTGQPVAGSVSDTTVNAIPPSSVDPQVDPRTPAQIAADDERIRAAGAISSEGIANPEKSVTTPGYDQTAGSQEDAGPTVAQNIRSSAATQAQNTASPAGPLPNPLDKYSSYTYNLALYICKPSDYNAYATAQDGISIGLPGNQLIARSGGSPVGQNQRNPFFSDIDINIDKLQIKSTIGFSETGLPTSVGDISFTLTEPAGATLLYRLQSAVAELANNDPTVGPAFYFNTTFAIIIRFYGYDELGMPSSASSINNPSAAGATENSIITKIFFFELTDIDTMIGSRIVEYHVKGVYTGNFIGKGAALGISPARFELTGTNLNDIFNGIPGSSNTTNQDSNPREETGAQNSGAGAKTSAQPSQNIPTRGLCQALNNENQRRARPDKQGRKVYEYADEYEIIFASEALKNAKVTIAGIDNSLTTAAGVKPLDTKAENTRKNTSVAKNAKNVHIDVGTPIIQWLDMMIRNSEYIKSQASLLLQEEPPENEAQGSQGAAAAKINQPKSPVKWYKITPYVKKLDYDTLRNVYACKIIYVISDYYITDPRTPYFKRAPWPGPDKLYRYVFTGQNTQVLQYEQHLNFLYRQTFELNAPLGQDPAKERTVASGRVDNSYAFRVVAGTGKQGSLGDSTDLAARAAAGIYSPTDFADVKIKVVGDPDYLFQDYYNITQAQLSREAYKRLAQVNGLSINYSELYMQISFLSGDDWNLLTGTVGLDPKNGYTRKVSAAYVINDVTSYFFGGQFTQDIEGVELSSVDPDVAIINGDYVSGTPATTGVNTSTTNANATETRKETTDNKSDASTFSDQGRRTQQGGPSTVPQSNTGALPAPQPPKINNNSVAQKVRSNTQQRAQVARKLEPNLQQIGNDDAIGEDRGSDIAPYIAP
jgi:hypothetical protein